MSRVGFRSFSRPLQRFLVATVVNMVGSGALFGFALIYLHEVRGLSLGRAGIAVGATSFTTLAVTPVAGALSDRFGARRILTIGCLLSIVAGALYAVITSFAIAIAVCTLMGAANGLWFPSQQALLALVVGPTERPAVSAFQRLALNLGAAIGGVVGGLLVRNNSLSAFRVLFAMNVGTYLVFLAVLRGMPSARVLRDSDERDRLPGFREVFADGFFVRLLITDISIGLGFGFLWGFMPAFASELGIGKATIGVLFTFGAASVALTQIPVLRWSSGKRRMNSLAVMNGWFVASFGLMLLTPHVRLAAAIVLIAAAQLVGGVGESLLGAVRQPLTSDIAPRELVGRYFGLSTMVFQACMGLANAVGGTVMQYSQSLVWAIPFTAAIAGIGGTLSLRARVPAHAAIGA